MEEKEEVFNKIEITGVSGEAINRYSKIVRLLIAKGALDVFTGTTILHWNDGFLNDIEITTHPYIRDIPKQYNKTI